ncbi:MAG: YebC/PmpR family DNA-binding transcriptional regulator [Oscillospiraceae bacterium]|jgi:YebC/PmpR family DNA-binding regulatory protein|nr:YebC/PmpR family DNA-binding transcriptional regulator [Oscillospiraceae bacterium]
MSGHSKWSTIKRKKEKTDSQRAKIFTKIGREIAVAVREGGPNPTDNSKLAGIIAKAKANNVPNDNVERIIKKAAGETGGASYEEILYEGYGPSGVAVIVETLTDNRNRTAGDLRHYFDKNGGNLGQNGCVAFLFTRQGQLIAEGEDVSEEQFMEDALEAGATDFFADDDVFDIRTEPADFLAVQEALAAKGYTFISTEIAYIAVTETALTDEEDVKKMERLLEMLEDNDDVQSVWHNWQEN